jgi:adenylate kinase
MDPIDTSTVANDRAAWLKGGTAECCVPAPRVNKPKRLVLLGAPGVGKGTQAELIHERMGACQLSTGDVFRAAKSSSCEGERSPALTAALDYMRRGELVPDSTVLDMVRERARCLRCHGGILLDGFPRTVAQAEALDRIFAENAIGLDAVLSYELPIEKIVARLSGRRTCEQCKAVYHVTSRPSKVEGVCDHCGGKLIQREDDRAEAVRVRMEAYERSTKPLADYYGGKGLLIPVSAEGSPEEIFARAAASLAQRGL